jgi:AcrR family transcriptional regulator
MESPMPSSRRLAATATAPLPAAVLLSASRRLILETSLRLFAERGYSGTSIRDIAAACGLQGPTIYSHYPSKEHVLAELVRIAHDEHLRRVRAVLLDSQPDPREQIRGWVRAHVGFHTECPMLAVVANSELHMLSPELGAPIYEVRKQSEQILMAIAQRGIDRGLFQVPHAWLAVAAIGGMGLRVAFWFAPEAGIPAADVAAAYAEFAVRLLQAPAAAASAA